jgi:hypothetical protein
MIEISIAISRWVSVEYLVSASDDLRLPTPRTDKTVAAREPALDLV